MSDDPIVWLICAVAVAAFVVMGFALAAILRGEQR